MLFLDCTQTEGTGEVWELVGSPRWPAAHVVGKAFIISTEKTG